MDWTKLLSQTRLCTEAEPSRIRPGRTEFDSDVDRIMFSSSFRRLAKKTQVHPLAANDHVHTRLTHSLEVSRVGRTLGEALADTLIRDAGEKYNPTLPAGIIPDDVGNIVQAACLAHDIGNAPFGHSGEEAIIHWFIQNRSLLPESLSDDMSHDIGALEGNAQGYRVITQIENHVFNGGLQLTYATLGAFQKYPWSSRRRVKKFGAYISEEEILDRVSEGLGLQRRSPHGWCRHPLAHLVEAADDICYAILDVEDAVELEIVTFEEAKRLLVKVLSESERSELEQSLAPPGMYRVNFARLRGRVFDRAISAALRAFLAGYTQIMAGNYDGSLMELLPEEDPCRLLINEAKQLGREKIYVYTKKVEIEIGAYSTTDTLLREFCVAALERAKALEDSSGEFKPSWKSQLVLRLLGDHAPSKDNKLPGGWTPYQCLRRAIDYVSGMTDNYAVYVAKQLQGGGFAGGQRP